MTVERPVVALSEVRKSFPGPVGPVEVLRGVSLTVNPGEVVCLVGPSGSGKSTLLRTINALETIDAGRVEVDGHDYAKTDLPIHQIRRLTAMIFQRFELFPHMSALENVSLGPVHVLRRPLDEARRAGVELIERVGLKDHMTKYPHQLSGGQQQRVAIARALALNPKCLLCDEPTSALDPELVHEVTEVLGGIARQNMTMVIVTHEITFARRIGGRLVFLDEGRIVEEGSIPEVLERPRSPRLAQFLRNIGKR